MFNLIIGIIWIAIGVMNIGFWHYDKVSEAKRNQRIEDGDQVNLTWNGQYRESLSGKEYWKRLGYENIEVKAYVDKQAP